MLVAWGQKDAAEKTLAQLRSARGPRDAERVALELEASRLRLIDDTIEPLTSRADASHQELSFPPL